MQSVTILINARAKSQSVNVEIGKGQVALWEKVRAVGADTGLHVDRPTTSNDYLYEMPMGWKIYLGRPRAF